MKQAEGWDFREICVGNYSIQRAYRGQFVVRFSKTHIEFWFLRFGKKKK